MTQNGKGKLNFGLIGCGRISQVHLQAIAKEPRATLVGVADIDPKAAAAAGTAFSVQYFTDAEALLKTVKPDAVVICTPPDSHRAITEAALAGGCHVLCEKPLAFSLEDAVAMLAAAECAERTLMMCSKFRYVQDIIRAKGMVESGILGEVVLFENSFCSHVDMKNRWNSRKETAGGGVLIDNGSHSVDIFRYLVGPIKNFQAVMGKRWQRIAVEDTCHLHLRSTDGTHGSVDVSWSIHKEDPYYIRIFGTEGMMEIGWKGSRYRQNEKLDWVNFGTGYDKNLAVSAQLFNFIETIIGRGTPIITGEDALESVRVIQRAYETVEELRWECVTQ